MARRRRRGGEGWEARLWRWLWWVGVPVVAVLVLGAVVRDIGPAYRARFGTSVSGRFTAVSRECNRGCTSTGDWISDDGGSSRRDVLLASGGGAPLPGQTVAAVDVGSSGVVYPPSGGWDWLIITVFAGVSVGGAVLWVITVVERLGRRRAGRVRRAG